MPENLNYIGSHPNPPGSGTGKKAAGNPAVLLVPERLRKGVSLRNLDESLDVYYGRSPSVNADTGFLLKAGESQAMGSSPSPIYIFAASGAPEVNYTEE